jgi:hypothetical protein
LYENLVFVFDNSRRRATLLFMPLNDPSSPPGAANVEEFRLVTSDDLAKRYNVSRRTIQVWVQRGLLPVIAISKRCLRFDIRKCDKALAKYEV